MADDDDLTLDQDDEEPAVRPAVLMPSEVNTAVTVPGVMKVYQLSPEERVGKYAPRRPTRADMEADVAEGLDSWAMAKKYSRKREAIIGLAKHYHIIIKAGRPDTTNAAERIALRREIEKEMAAKVDAMPGKETNAVPKAAQFTDRLTREFLEVEIQRHSAVEIGKMVGCSGFTVGNYLKKFNIPNPHQPFGRRAGASHGAKEQRVADDKLNVHGTDTMAGDAQSPAESVAPQSAPTVPPEGAAAPPEGLLTLSPAELESMLRESRAAGIAEFRAEAERLVQMEAAKPAQQSEAASTPEAKKPPLTSWQTRARFHKLIDGMLDELPSLQAGWSDEELQAWETVFDQLLRLVYRIGPSTKPAAG